MSSILSHTDNITVMEMEPPNHLSVIIAHGPSVMEVRNHVKSDNDLLIVILPSIIKILISSKYGKDHEAELNTD